MRNHDQPGIRRPSPSIAVGGVLLGPGRSPLGDDPRASGGEMTVTMPA